MSIEGNPAGSSEAEPNNFFLEKYKYLDRNIEIAHTPRQKTEAVALKKAFDCVLTRLEIKYEKDSGAEPGAVLSGEVDRDHFESYVNGLSSDDIAQLVELVRERHQGFLDAIEDNEEEMAKEGKDIVELLDKLDEVVLRSDGTL